VVPHRSRIDHPSQFHAIRPAPLFNSLAPNQDTRLDQIVTPTAERIVFTLQAHELNFVGCKFLQRLPALEFTRLRLFQLVAQSAPPAAQFRELRVGP
jgi:hypothetical protein